MDRTGLRRWIEAYEKAWRSPGVDALTKLFSEDADYSTGPFEEPHKGLEAIAAMWERERQGPEEDFGLSTEVVAVDGDTGVVRVEVRYGEPREQLYRDLWVVRFDGIGLCEHFEEWPFWPPGTDGTIAAGAA